MYLGMRTVGDSKDIPDYRCAEYANIETSQPNVLCVRNGFVKVNSTSIGAAINGIFGYVKPYDKTPVIITGHTTKLETV